MFRYKPHFVPSSIVLIGAGGTGSRLIGPLAQLVRGMLNSNNPQSWIFNLPIFIFDADVVEEKNLVRQTFIQQDVGKNKAGVIANRYSNAYGIPIHHCRSMFTENIRNDKRIFGTNLPAEGFLHNSIVILAVDNNNARREILDTINSDAFGARYTEKQTDGTNLFIVDAGNEDDFGQVKFFTNHVLLKEASTQTYLDMMPKMLPVEKTVDFIPIDLNYYRNLGTSQAELSCVNLPQTLAINYMMAGLILSVVQNFLLMKSMNYDCIRFGLNGAVSTEFNTIHSWSNRTLDGETLAPGPSFFTRHTVKDVPAIRPGTPYYRPKYLNSIIRSYRKDLVTAFAEKGLSISADGSLKSMAPPRTPDKVVAETETEKAPLKKTRASGPPPLVPLESIPVSETAQTPVPAPVPTAETPRNPPPLVPVLQETRDRPAA